MDESELSPAGHCFVPEILVDYLHRRNEAGISYLEPSSFFLHGVCLLVDISGFTKLSGDFCDQGKRGIDELQLATNGYMGKLVDIIYSFGGDIIKFAGDAIICVFSSNFVTSGAKAAKDRSSCFGESFVAYEIEMNASSSGKGGPDCVTAEVVLRSSLCACALREVQTEKLSVHVAMSAGEICFGILGGYDNRWECLISGPCIQVLSACLDDAPSKHAVLCPACFDVLQKHFGLPAAVTPQSVTGNITSAGSHLRAARGPYDIELKPLPSGNYEIINTLLLLSTSVTAGVTRGATSGIASNGGSVASGGGSSAGSGGSSRLLAGLTAGPLSALRVVIPPSGSSASASASAARLRTASSNVSLTPSMCTSGGAGAGSGAGEQSKLYRFVPVPVTDELENGVMSLNYLAEIREVTTMFMKVSSWCDSD
jgi:uncharacterized membrane protein YgcG